MFIFILLVVRRLQQQCEPVSAQTAQTTHLTQHTKPRLYFFKCMKKKRSLFHISKKSGLFFIVEWKYGADVHNEQRSMKYPCELGRMLVLLSTPISEWALKKISSESGDTRTKKKKEKKYKQNLVLRSLHAHSLSRSHTQLHLTQQHVPSCAIVWPPVYYGE